MSRYASHFHADLPLPISRLLLSGNLDSAYAAVLRLVEVLSDLRHTIDYLPPNGDARDEHVASLLGRCASLAMLGNIAGSFCSEAPENLLDPINAVSWPIALARKSLGPVVVGKRAFPSAAEAVSGTADELFNYLLGEGGFEELVTAVNHGDFSNFTNHRRLYPAMVRIVSDRVVGYFWSEHVSMKPLTTAERAEDGSVKFSAALDEEARSLLEFIEEQLDVGIQIIRPDGAISVLTSTLKDWNESRLVAELKIEFAAAAGERELLTAIAGGIPDPPQTSAANDQPTKQQLDAKGISILAQNPGIPISSLAEELGFKKSNRTSIYRLPGLAIALQARKSLHAKPPRGTKSRDGSLDAEASG